MPAPKHNNNARKWTEKRVLGHLAEIDAIIENPNEYFLGQILNRLGLYPDLWAYWEQRYGEHDEIMDLMGLIKDKLEANIFVASLKRELPAPFAIMNLKMNYGWRDKPKCEESELVKTLQIVHSDVSESQAA